MSVRVWHNPASTHATLTAHRHSARQTAAAVQIDGIIGVVILPQQHHHKILHPPQHVLLPFARYHAVLWVSNRSDVITNAWARVHITYSCVLLNHHNMYYPLCHTQPTIILCRPPRTKVWHRLSMTKKTECVNTITFVITLTIRMVALQWQINHSSNARVNTKIIHSKKQTKTKS